MMMNDTAKTDSVTADSDLSRAKNLLAAHGYTCVLCKGDTTYTSTGRGVKPLLQWLEAKTDMTGCSAADKVVGNAAAYLYVLLDVKAVYAPVMSEAAIRTLGKHGIQALCDLPVNAIRNRKNTGFCPMEEAVRNAVSPQEALALVKARLKQIKQKENQHHGKPAL